MKYTIDKHDRYIVIEPLSTHLDAEKTAKLKGEFLLRNTIGQKNIILDMSNVQSVDESGVRLAILANRLCHSVGGLFLITNAGQEVVKMLELSSMVSNFQILSSVQEAEDLVFAHEIENDYRKSNA